MPIRCLWLWPYRCGRLPLLQLFLPDDLATCKFNFPVRSPRLCEAQRWTAVPSPARADASGLSFKDAPSFHTDMGAYCPWWLCATRGSLLVAPTGAATDETVYLKWSDWNWQRQQIKIHGAAQTEQKSYLDNSALKFRWWLRLGKGNAKALQKPNADTHRADAPYSWGISDQQGSSHRKPRGRV